MSNLKFEPTAKQDLVAYRLLREDYRPIEKMHEKCPDNGEWLHFISRKNGSIVHVGASGVPMVHKIYMFAHMVYDRRNLQ